MDANYTFSQNPGGTAHTYATGQLVGGKMTFDLSIFKGVKGAFVLEQVLIDDPAAQGKNADLVLFKGNPAATTFTDNAAFTVNAADLGKIIGIVPITNHHAFAANSVSRANQLAMPLKLDPSANGDMNLYAALVTRSNPTYTATDLTVSLTLRTPDSLADGAAN